MEHNEDAADQLSKPPDWWYYATPVTLVWISALVVLEMAFALDPRLLVVLLIPPLSVHLTATVTMARNTAKMLTMSANSPFPQSLEPMLRFSLKGGIGIFRLPKSISEKRRWFIPLYYGSLALPILAVMTGVALIILRWPH